VEITLEQLIKSVIMEVKLAAQFVQNLILVTVVQTQLEVVQQDALEYVEMELDYLQNFVIMGINLDVLLAVE
jgi:hypothetical protein